MHYLPWSYCNLIEVFFFSKMKQRNLIKCIFNILEKIKLSQYLQKYDFPFKGIHLHEWQYLVIAAVFYNNTMNNVWTLFELGLKNWDGCTNCSLEFWPSSNHMFGKYNSYFNDQGVNILHSHGQIPSVNRYSIFMLENFFFQIKFENLLIVDSNYYLLVHLII